MDVERNLYLRIKKFSTTPKLPINTMTHIKLQNRALAKLLKEESQNDVTDPTMRLNFFDKICWVYNCLRAGANKEAKLRPGRKKSFFENFKNIFCFQDADLMSSRYVA